MDNLWSLRATALRSASQILLSIAPYWPLYICMLNFEIYLAPRAPACSLFISRPNPPQLAESPAAGRSLGAPAVALATAPMDYIGQL